MPGTCVEEISTAKCQLQEFYERRYRGARVRVRNNRAVHCENPTRQNSLDERRHAVTEFIRDMNSNCVLLTSTEEISSVFENYSTELTNLRIARTALHFCKDSYEQL